MLRDLCKAKAFAFGREMAMLQSWRPGEVPQARAALAFRTALSCTFAAGLVLAPVPAWLRVWMAKGLMVPAIQVSFFVQFAELGDTVKSSLVVALATPVMLLYGSLLAYVSNLIGGASGQRWVATAFMPLFIFSIVVGGSVAETIQKPWNLFWGNAGAAWLVSAMPILVTWSLMEALQTYFALCVGQGIVCAFVLLVTCLPFGIGPQSARRRVSGLLSAKLTSVADYLEAVALRRGPANITTLERRYDALQASVALRGARASAVYPVWGSNREVPGFANMSTDAEACRLALQVEHFAPSQPTQNAIARFVHDTMNRSEFGHSRLDLAKAASCSLRSAASLISAAAKLSMPPAFDDAQFLGITSSADESQNCHEAAQACRAEIHKYSSKWDGFAENTCGSLSQQYGNLAGPTAATGSAATDDKLNRRRIFVEESQYRMANMAACSAATTAANIAEEALKFAAATEEATVPCAGDLRNSGGVGLVAWLRAPCAGFEAWCRALHTVGFRGIRNGVGVGMACAIGLLIFPDSPANTFWIAVTTGICLLPTQGSAFLKGFRRFFGTFLGVGLGFLSAWVAKLDPLMVWSHVPMVAFGLKFFESELQYIGAVAWVTYSLFIGDIGADPTMGALIQLSKSRLIDVNLGIAIATFVSIFIAPERSIDAIRSLELEAFKCGVESFRSGSAALAGALSNDAADSSTGSANDQEFCIGLREQVGPLYELRKRIKACMDSFDFGGDGLPGVGDRLSDARWELRIGADGGCHYFKGLLWLPTCCHRRSHARVTGRRCLKVVPLLHRLLRQSYTLLALSEKIERGDKLLNDSRVAAALGSDGSRLADPVATAIQALSLLLLENGSEGDTGKMIDGEETGNEDEETGSENSDEIANNLETARSGLELLVDEAAVVHAEIGGIGNCAAGGQAAPAILVTMERMLSSFDLLQKLIQGTTDETETSEDEAENLS